MLKCKAHSVMAQNFTANYLDAKSEAIQASGPVYKVSQGNAQNGIETPCLTRKASTHVQCLEKHLNGL